MNLNGPNHSGPKLLHGLKQLPAEQVTKNFMIAIKNRYYLSNGLEIKGRFHFEDMKFDDERGRLRYEKVGQNKVLANVSTYFGKS